MDMIDVSHHQGNIDWNKVASDGHKGAIIKATEGSEAGTSFVDGKMNRNYRQAKANGLETTFYHYARFVSKKDAKAEADWFIKNIKDKHFTMPPMLDLEENHCGDNKKMNKAAKVFLKRVEKELGFVGLYSFGHFYRDSVSKKLSKRYAYWHARYASDPINEDLSDLYMWQYSSEGSVSGIYGNVDMNKTGGMFFTLDEVNNKSSNDKKGNQKMKMKKLQKQINKLQDELDKKVNESKLDEKLDKPSDGNEAWDSHKDDMQWMKDEGITKSDQPHKYVSREQVASFLKRYYENNELLPTWMYDGIVNNFEGIAQYLDKPEQWKEKLDNHELKSNELLGVFLIAFLTKENDILKSKDSDKDE